LIPPFITKGDYPDKDKLLTFLKSKIKKDRLVLVDAAGIAAALGSQITMNMVLLGAASGTGALDINKAKLRAAIKGTSLAQYIKINLEAFERGFDCIRL